MTNLFLAERRNRYDILAQKLTKKFFNYLQKFAVELENITNPFDFSNFIDTHEIVESKTTETPKYGQAGVIRLAVMKHYWYTYPDKSGQNIKIIEKNKNEITTQIKEGYYSISFVYIIEFYTFEYYNEKKDSVAILGDFATEKIKTIPSHNNIFTIPETNAIMIVLKTNAPLLSSFRSFSFKLFSKLDWNNFYFMFLEAARHEIEHALPQAARFNQNLNQITTVDFPFDKQQRNILINQQDSLSEEEYLVKYYQLQSEIEAELRSLYLIAKKHKIPFGDFIYNRLKENKFSNYNIRIVLNAWKNYGENSPYLKHIAKELYLN